MSAPSLVVGEREPILEAGGCPATRLSSASGPSSFPNSWMSMNSRAAIDFPELLPGIGDAKDEKQLVDADEIRLQKLWHQLRQEH
jgi:hypothetical protein